MDTFAQSILEAVRHPLLILNRRLEIVTANAAFHRVFPLGPMDVLGRSIYEIDGERWNIARLRGMLNNLAETGVAFEGLEIEYHSDQLGMRIMTMSARQAASSDDPEPMILLAIEDETAKKQAELSEQRNHRVLEALPHMIWMTDREGQTNYVNGRMEKGLGFPEESFFGWDWLENVYPEDREQVRRLWATALESGGEYRSKLRMPVADGRYRWFLAQARPVCGKDGEIERWIGSLTDIDNLKSSEAELKRTSELLRAVADNATDAIFVKDHQGRYLLFNVAASRFVGQPAEEILGKDDTALFGPEDAQFVIERDRRVMGTGEAETQEEHLTAAGITRVYLATKAPYRDADGNIVGTIGISRDITERKRAEEALKVSEERFRAFMDNSPAGAWITDIDGRILYVSATYSRMVGIKAECLIGRSLFDLFSAELAEHYLENTRTVAQTGKVLETIEPGLRANGTTGEFLVYKFPLSDSQRRTIVGGISVDVTERRQMEEMLRLRDRAIGAATQGILIADAMQPDNPIIYVSPGFERLTGYASSEMLGRNCRILQGDDTDPRTKSRLREAMAAGEPCMVEILNYRKDGTPFWNQLSISPVRDADGRLTHFVGVQSDVTQRRQLEEQFQHSQKMEAIGQLAGGIAHDFNNLLTIINGFAGALLDQTPLDHPNRDPLEEIVKAGERSAKLTEQLLTFCRRQFVALEILDLNTIISGGQDLLKRLIGEHIELTTLLWREPLLVKADAGQIEQILLNLAVNARDAMPQGGQLLVNTQAIELTVESCRGLADVEAGFYAMLSVTDNGSGMSPAVRTRIFEPFFTTKRERGGTGLGLAVIHGIVKQSGGHLEVISEVGAGTTFKILLPREREGMPSNTKTAESDSYDLPTGSETILLVEDEPGVRQFAKKVLENCGYIVVDAANGSEAMQGLESTSEMFASPVRLLITDVVMPGEAGSQLAERILKDHPGVQVIFISGYTDDTVLRHGIRNSEVNFLQKPFTSLELAQKVRAILDKQ